MANIIFLTNKGLEQIKNIEQGAHEGLKELEQFNPTSSRSGRLQVEGSYYISDTLQRYSPTNCFLSQASNNDNNRQSKDRLIYNLYRQEETGIFIFVFRGFCKDHAKPKEQKRLKQLITADPDAKKFREEVMKAVLNNQSSFEYNKTTYTRYQLKDFIHELNKFAINDAKNLTELQIKKADSVKQDKEQNETQDKKLKEPKTPQDPNKFPQKPFDSRSTEGRS